MDDYVYMRLSEIYMMAYYDVKYCELLNRLEKLEVEYDEVLKTLTESQYETACDYYALYHEMTARMLEIACQNLRLMDE